MSFFKSTNSKHIFESRKVVHFYNSLKSLQKPEETILNFLKDKLKDITMLDIGVGAGRTTHFFSDLTKEYIGIDFAENMIKKCRENFPERKNLMFKVCDVRSMKIFQNNYFDFILFSFNGIDNLSHEDRIGTLREIKRVCKKEGFFCFSTHNLRSIDKLLEIHFSKNPVEMAKRILKYLLLRTLNEKFEKLKNEKFTFVNDGLYQFRTKRYYINPEEQIRQLMDLGYHHIKIYLLEDGKELENTSQLNTIKDDWLYYLCNAF